MELTNEVYDSLRRYFSALTHFGYKSYSQVNSLLIFIFIEELLCGPMAEYVTEEDYKYISDSLYCLYGKSCLIPYPSYKKSIEDKSVFVPCTCEFNSKV